MSRSDVSPDLQGLYDTFDRCNSTELYQLARRAGYPVLPNYSKDALIRTVLPTEKDPPKISHEIDEWRLALMRFVIDHRKQLETQLSCPAKSFEPTACSACIDVQVLNCVTSNGPENFRLIKLLKKTP